LPKRPKDQGRVSVKEHLGNKEPLPPSGMREISKQKVGEASNENLGVGRILFPRAEKTKFRTFGVRPDPVEELAGIWTANNLPSENIVGILEIASEAFDDSEKALRWLQEPNIQTGQKPPVSLIGTPEGFATVESVLRQIQYGVFG
jgi:hypothetical protein